MRRCSLCLYCLLPFSSLIAMRATSIGRMVMPLNLIPGRPASRGFMYRPTNMNAYSKVGCISPAQRNNLENLLFAVITNPMLYYWIYTSVWIIPFAGLIAWSCSQFGTASNRNRELIAALGQDELWERNSDMQKIFDDSKRRTEEARQKAAAAAGCVPSIFYPPDVALRFKPDQRLSNALPKKESS